MLSENSTLFKIFTYLAFYDGEDMMFATNVGDWLRFMYRSICKTDGSCLKTQLLGGQGHAFYM